MRWKFSPKSETRQIQDRVKQLGMICLNASKFTKTTKQKDDSHRFVEESNLWHYGRQLLWLTAVLESWNMQNGRTEIPITTPGGCWLANRTLSKCDQNYSNITRTCFFGQHCVSIFWHQSQNDVVFLRFYINGCLFDKNEMEDDVFWQSHTTKPHNNTQTQQ